MPGTAPTFSALPFGLRVLRWRARRRTASRASSSSGSSIVQDWLQLQLLPTEITLAPIWTSHLPDMSCTYFCIMEKEYICIAMSNNCNHGICIFICCPNLATQAWWDQAAAWSHWAEEIRVRFKHHIHCSARLFVIIWVKLRVSHLGQLKLLDLGQGAAQLGAVVAGHLNLALQCSEVISDVLM